jgi:hypothetical protein
MDGTQLEGRLTASLIDVAVARGLDSREAPATLLPRLTADRAQVLAYMGQGLALLLNGERQPIAFGAIQPVSWNGEPALEFAFTARAPLRIDSVDVGYTLFFEDDVLHEALARFEWQDGAASEAVFRLGEPLQHAARGAGTPAGFLQFLRSGIWHIWTGYDHVLFLLALLLPAVLLHAQGSWIAAPVLPAALWRATSIVTAFTLAHSITLACAALGLIRVPQQVVEAAIAASVFIAAACNLVPAAARLQGAGMAFAFGLLHGFGFAGVLVQLVPATGQVWRPLLAFNLGVELGQLAIVALFLPLAWKLRATGFYRRGLVPWGSAIVCGCAAIWFMARIS